MARGEDDIPISGTLSRSDNELFERLQAALEGTSKARLVRILLHYAIPHADEALADLAREALGKPKRAE